MNSAPFFATGIFGESFFPDGEVMIKEKSLLGSVSTT